MAGDQKELERRVFVTANWPYKVPLIHSPSAEHAGWGELDSHQVNLVRDAFPSAPFSPLTYFHDIW